MADSDGRPRMAGLSVGIVGTGGVGIAAAGAILQQGLAGRITLYDRTGHARERGARLPPRSRCSRARRCVEAASTGSTRRTCWCSPSGTTQTGETRLDVLQENLAILTAIAEAVEHGGMPRIAMVVTSPSTCSPSTSRRWSHLPVSVMGSGTSLDTLRFTERLAQECGVHPRSVPWVVGEHGDSSVFLHSRRDHRRDPVPDMRDPARHRRHTRVDRGRGARRPGGLPVRELKGLGGPRHRAHGERPRALHRARVGHHPPGVGTGRRPAVREPAAGNRARRTGRAAVAARTSAGAPRGSRPRRAPRRQRVAAHLIRLHLPLTSQARGPHVCGVVPVREGPRVDCRPPWPSRRPSSLSRATGPPPRRHPGRRLRARHRRCVPQALAQVKMPGFRPGKARAAASRPRSGNVRALRDSLRVLRRPSSPSRST